MTSSDIDFHCLTNRFKSSNLYYFHHSTFYIDDVNHWCDVINEPHLMMWRKMKTEERKKKYYNKLRKQKSKKQKERMRNKI